MKLTKQKLKQLIKEELQKVLNEKSDQTCYESHDSGEGRRYYVLRPSQYAEGPVPEKLTDPANSYQIKAGDTLEGIAEKEYGPGKRPQWTTIYYANECIATQHGKQGETEEDIAKRIQAGNWLIIPTPNT